VSRWPVAGPSEYWLLASSPASKVKKKQYPHSTTNTHEITTHTRQLQQYTRSTNNNYTKDNLKLATKHARQIQTWRDQTAAFCVCFSNAPINSNLSIKGCVSYYSMRIMKTALGPDAILSTSIVHGRYNLWTSLYLSFTFPLAASLKAHDTSKIHRWGHLLVPVEQDAHHVRTKCKSRSRTAFLWSCLILYLLVSLKKNLCWL